MEVMEIDSSDASNGSLPARKDNDLRLYPVSTGKSGEGLPYAPEDWPNPGDKWSWKAGKRIAVAGYFLDRYLYLPNRLRKKGQCTGFGSRLSVEQYIRTEFPDADVDAFFASFSWKIPSRKITRIKDKMEQLGSDSRSGTTSCKAGNRLCSSLADPGSISSEVIFCDICCSEPGFCRDCCCILCCNSTDSAYGGYNYIRCEAIVLEGCICGHIAHVDCALRAYMAGTVGGNIGLDAQYYCRRCGSRTDLVAYVTKILETCKSIDSRDDIEKILKVAWRILQGSQRVRARQLLHHTELAMEKLKNATDLADVWKDDISSTSTGKSSYNGNGSSEITTDEMPLDYVTSSSPEISSKFDYRVESIRLEDEIDQILRELRNSQEFEYRLAEKVLYAQRNFIQNLYKQLDKKKSELVKQTLPAVLDPTLEMINKIKGEFIKLKNMEKVSKGFGRTSKLVLKEHFGLEEDI